MMAKQDTKSLHSIAYGTVIEFRRSIPCEFRNLALKAIVALYRWFIINFGCK